MRTREVLGVLREAADYFVAVDRCLVLSPPVAKQSCCAFFAVEGVSLMTFLGEVDRDTTLGASSTRRQNWRTEGKRIHV